MQPSSSDNNNRIAEDDHTIMKIQYKLKTSTGKKNYPAPKQVYRILKNNTLKVAILLWKMKMILLKILSHCYKNISIKER
jgi:hypothetical protein